MGCLSIAGIAFPHKGSIPAGAARALLEEAAKGHVPGEAEPIGPHRRK